MLVLDARLALQASGTGPNARPAAGGGAGTGAAEVFFPQLWEALVVFCRAHAALGSDQQLGLFVAHARRAALLVGGMCAAVDWEATRRTTVAFALEDAGLPGEPLLAAALSRALCLAHRLRRRGGGGELRARCLVLEGSASEADLSSQGPALINCAFAAQAAGILIDCLALGAEPSMLMRQVAGLTAGKHHSLPPVGREHRPEDILVPVLLFHFMPGVDTRKELNLVADTQHHSAVCLCHGERRELAHVCSCCLAVFCSDAAAICPVCGTRFRHERDADRRLLDTGL